MKQAIAMVLLLCMLLWEGCKEEDYVYPSVVTEFIGAQTDSDGTISQLVADNGTVYPVLQRDGLGGLVADTLYRTISIYEPLPQEDGKETAAQLYSCQLVLSMNPLAEKAFKGQIKTDPVDIQSIWLSGNYVNMILLVQYKDQAHAYHFIDEGFTANEDGTRTLNLRLYHDRKNDYEAFTKQVYLSVPLKKYLQSLQKGDKIRFYLNTYKEQETYREFDYQ